MRFYKSLKSTFPVLITGILMLIMFKILSRYWEEEYNNKMLPYLTLVNYTKAGNASAEVQSMTFLYNEDNTIPSDLPLNTKADVLQEIVAATHSGKTEHHVYPLCKDTALLNKLRTVESLLKQDLDLLQKIIQLKSNSRSINLNPSDSLRRGQNVENDFQANFLLHKKYYAESEIQLNSLEKYLQFVIQDSRQKLSTLDNSFIIINTFILLIVTAAGYYAARKADRDKEEEHRELVKHEKTEKEEINNFLFEISKANFNVDLHLPPNHELLKPLVNMKSTLHENYTGEMARTWMAKGLADASEIMRNFLDDSQLLYDNLLSFIIRYINVNQVALYIVKNDDPEILVLKSCYAYGRKKHYELSIHSTDNLVGQCFTERKKIYLIDVPKGYTYISSGLGETTPSALLLLPLMMDEQLNGVIEIAALEPLNSAQIELLEELAKILCSTITSINVSSKTNELLNRMKAQENELLTKEEELRESIERMQIKSDENTAEKKQMQQILNGSLEAIVTLDAYEKINLVNKTTLDLLGYASHELITKPSAILLTPEMREIYPNGLLSCLTALSTESTNKLIEVDIVGKHNKILTCRIKYLQLAISKGTGYVLYLSNVTEQQNLMLDYKDKLEAINQAIMFNIMNEDGKFLEVNEEFCQFSKYSRAELLDHSFSLLFPGDQNAAQASGILKTLKEGNAWKGNLQFTSKDGIIYWVNVSFNQMKQNNAEEKKFIAVYYNATAYVQNKEMAN